MKFLFILLFLLAASSRAENFAVLLAKDDPKTPVGYPTNWPVQVQPIGDAKELPPKFQPPWRLVTQAQVDKWKADHAAEMEAYQAAQEAAATQPKRDRETAFKQAMEELKGIRDGTSNLTTAQVLRLFAKVLIAILEELHP